MQRSPMQLRRQKSIIDTGEKSILDNSEEDGTELNPMDLNLETDDGMHKEESDAGSESDDGTMVKEFSGSSLRQSISQRLLFGLRSPEGSQTVGRAMEMGPSALRDCESPAICSPTIRFAQTSTFFFQRDCSAPAGLTDKGSPSRSSIPLLHDQRCLQEVMVSGTVLWAESILYEVEYPWMFDRPILHLTGLSEELRPPDGLSGTQVPAELTERIRSLFRADLRQTITDVIIDFTWSTDNQPFWKVVFTEPIYAQRAHLAMKESSLQAKVMLTNPCAPTRRKKCVFITKFEQDSSSALQEALKSLDVLPASLDRFDADFKAGPAELVWRATFIDEEYARRALAAYTVAQADGRLPCKLEIAYQPSPFTKGLIICFRTPAIPKELIRKLRLYHTPKNYSHQFTVEEFEYALRTHELQDDQTGQRTRIEKGDVFYDIDEYENEKHAYARLVTQNWWYKQLFMALLWAALAVLDMYSNVVFAASMFGTGKLYQNLSGRYFFVFSFFSVQAFLCVQCAITSLYQVQHLERAGDLIAAQTLYDRVVTHSASFLFHFVQIPTMVKDIVKTLHPWTNVQEKAALKMRGTRVFIIGFANEHMYRCHDQAGTLEQFPPLILSRLLLLLFKIIHAYSCASYVAIFTSLVGVVFWPIQFAYFRALLNDRGVLCEYLKQRAAKLDLPIDSLSRLRNERHTLSPTQRGFVANWEKHFGRFEDLSAYSRVWDAIPFDFWIMIAILIIANGIICVLHRTGALTFDVTVVPELNVTASTLFAADVDGDGILSPVELESVGLYM